MESQPQNPEYRINPENFHPCIFTNLCWKFLPIWTFPEIIFYASKFDSSSYHLDPSQFVIYFFTLSCNVSHNLKKLPILIC